MKLNLNEVRQLVRSLLKESVCTKCGYDNPYMDDDPQYVCAQCKTRGDKWGGGSPFSKDSHGQEEELAAGDGYCRGCGIIGTSPGSDLCNDCSPCVYCGHIFNANDMVCKEPDCACTECKPEDWNTCSTCGHELSPDGPGCAQDPNCDCDSCLNGEGPDSNDVDWLDDATMEQEHPEAYKAFEKTFGPPDTDGVFRLDGAGTISVHPGDQPGIDTVHHWDSLRKKWI